LKNSNFEAVYWNTLIDLISKIRQEKSMAKKAMNAEIALTLNSKDMMILKTGLLDDLKNVMNATEINEGKFKVEFK